MKLMKFQKNNKHSSTNDFCSVIENININELDELKKSLLKINIMA